MGVADFTKSDFGRPESDDIKAKFLDVAAAPIWRTPADTLAYRDSEEVWLAPIIKASGARVE